MAKYLPVSFFFKFLKRWLFSSLKIYLCSFCEKMHIAATFLILHASHKLSFGTIPKEKKWKKIFFHVLVEYISILMTNSSCLSLQIRNFRIVGLKLTTLLFYITIKPLYLEVLQKPYHINAGNHWTIKVTYSNIKKSFCDWHFYHVP